MILEMLYVPELKFITLKGRPVPIEHSHRVVSLTTLINVRKGN